MSSRFHFFAISLVLVFSGFGATAADQSPKDYPQLRKFERSEILFYKERDYDRLKLALSKIEWNGAEGKPRPFESKTVEGRRVTIYYRVPVGPSVMEVAANYRNEFREKGFETLFSGEGAQIETPGYNNTFCSEVYQFGGAYDNPEGKAGWLLYTADDKVSAYVAAKKTGGAPGGGDLYASAYILSNTQKDWLGLAEGQTVVRLDICEEKELSDRMVLVKAEEMASKIQSTGRIALYGILFDFNKTDIKPESIATLEEIARLMKATPGLNVIVAGHTDAVGTFEFNRGLSQRRAESVVKWLSENGGVSRQRLFPVGVSFAAPVAANTSEEGRAKNRRVELVDMAGGKVP